MKKKELENRIKELELELSYLKSSKSDKQDSPESEQRFRSLVEQSLSPILILKGENMVLDVANEPSFKILNVGKEALGKPFLEILPEMKDQPFMDLLLDVLHNHTTHYGKEQPTHFMRENGETQTVYFNFIYQPYKENDGSISGIIVFATDITEQVIAYKKIKESEFRFHNMVYTSPSMIAIFKGKEMIIEIANDAIIETWGKGKDVIGKSLFEVLPEASEQGFDKLIQSVYETGEPIHAYEMPITLLRNSKQQLMHYNFIYQAQRNLYGEIEGVAILANEVTPQVEAKIKVKESEERFRLLADNVPLNIFIIEPTAEANISYWNKHWLDYTGQTMEEALDRAWDNIIHPDDVQPIMEVYVPAFEARLPYHLPCIRIRRYDGEYRWFAVQANPRYLPNGEFMGYIGVGFDVHEQKLLEIELIKAKEFAENAVKSKQQFLSNMSHEIRTPLNSILGFANVLLKTDLGEKQKEYTKAIKTSGNSLNLLINDILDLAKVDAGKMTFEKQPFDIRKSIRAMLHSFDLKIKEKNLALVSEYAPEIPEMLVGDSSKLNQIILNLMSNAIKFTHKGEIRLSVKIKKENKKNISIEFAITDTGIGIADDKINTVFNLFEQAEINISNFYGGTGLGLAIVKQLVEFQGGTISVRSKIGEGSTFGFIMPFEKTNVKIAEEVEILKLDENTKKLRILVAEDVVLNQLLIKIILADFGFEYEVVSNGKFAIEKLETNIYDIILMDLQMPEMNGFEATNHIRTILKLDTPILALTADVTTVDLAKCKEAGMNDYLAKPIDEKLLYTKIVALVKKNIVNKKHAIIKKVILGKTRYINLNYLNERTKSNSALMLEMIALYLEQTPPLIASMNLSFQNRDWDLLHKSVHKILPSFSIMGIDIGFEKMAQKILEYALAMQTSEIAGALITELGAILTQSCEELREEILLIKNKTK